MSWLGLSFVSSLVRLDFGHFRAGINVRQVFIRFQSICSPSGTEVCALLSKKWPDTTRIVELAKVQVRRSDRNRYALAEWVHQQVYLHPYPKELMLRNRVWDQQRTDGMIC
jgi:hypothetical protein